MEPAKSIVKRLGGAATVAEVTGVHVTRVYKWCKPKEKQGTGGIIPHWHIKPLREYAAKIGISLSADDFFPIKEKGTAV